jgi:hypothetical protein
MFGCDRRRDEQIITCYLNNLELNVFSCHHENELREETQFLGVFFILVLSFDTQRKKPKHAYCVQSKLYVCPITNTHVMYKN